MSTFATLTILIFKYLPAECVQKQIHPGFKGGCLIEEKLNIILKST